MDRYSQDVIKELGQKEFDTHDFVSKVNQQKDLQIEYIELSNEYGSYNKLNAQIGRYLGREQKRLGICKNGDKKVSITNTGRRSPNQKWKILLIPFLLLFISMSSYSQILTPQQNSKSKWGYVNETGKVVIKYKYDQAKEFSEELAAIDRNGKWGYIDKAGKVIIPLIYDIANNFSEGLAKVINLELGGWSLIDKTGKDITSLKYDKIGDFSEEGLAKVKISNTYGFIDKNGKVIIPMKYNNVSDFSNGYAAYAKESRIISYYDWGIIDIIGQEVLPAKYTEEEVTELLSDPALVQEKIKKEAEKEAEKKILIEDIQTVLDNDYYSKECPSWEILEKLMYKLTKLKDATSDKEKEQLDELYKNLWNAVRTKSMTEKYGTSTAKKIMAGKYEINMSKDVCFEAIAHYDPFISEGNRYVFNAKLSSETKTTEIWEVVAVAPGYKKMLWTFINGKLTSIVNY